ncbi:MAG: hypothetical protein PGN34_05470 [Methylobacterium frigidaeris]
MSAEILVMTSGVLGAVVIVIAACPASWRHGRASASAGARQRTGLLLFRPRPWI